MACRRLASGTADDSRCGLQLKNEWYEEDPQDNYVKGFKQCKKLFTSHSSPLMYLDVHCLCRSIAQEKNIPPFYFMQGSSGIFTEPRFTVQVYYFLIHHAAETCRHGIANLLAPRGGGAGSLDDAKCVSARCHLAAGAAASGLVGHRDKT